MSRITANEIKTQEFKTKLRGLDPQQVQMFLHSVAEEMARLNLENAELHEAIGSLKTEISKHSDREQTLQKTLVTAQSMTEDLKSRSQAEAELTVREARMRAEQTLQDSQDQLSRLETEIGRSKLERDLFEKRLRTLLEEHLELVDRRSAERDDLDNVHLLPRRNQTEAG
ncbi:MAG: DivIVA domain-containing protein [Acidobacteriota bacterium]|nr:DivIVA domain-containing protein [Acidobacteriota bacterium]MDH3786429.1 DivIVA domain-containing protein [Acidobacteriota bacterium]